MNVWKKFFQTCNIICLGAKYIHNNGKSYKEYKLYKLIKTKSIYKSMTINISSNQQNIFNPFQNF